MYRFLYISAGACTVRRGARVVATVLEAWSLDGTGGDGSLCGTALGYRYYRVSAFGHRASDGSDLSCRNSYVYWCMSIVCAAQRQH